mmetsp:Transcript_27394/g.43910  ORF Transcript_27394/g.43910 Transcript_27394/m.43910 type:complete len:94 (-) Transcript_27394:467-748(-)
MCSAGTRCQFARVSQVYHESLAEAQQWWVPGDLAQDLFVRLWRSLSTNMQVTNSSRSIGEENTRFIRRLSMTITAARASEGNDTGTCVKSVRS